jgi:peptidyl-prolyl cis-trans isomerase SurA
MMKFLSLLLVSFLFGWNVQAQTVIKYGKYKVDLKEVLKAYNRNHVQGDDATKLADYLKLFADFKLKVQAAKDAKLDTLGSIQKDIASFRDQLAESYLNDESSMQQMLEEAKLRNSRDLYVVYFYAPLNENNPAAGEAAMQQIFEHLQNGSINYEQLAADFSTTESPISFLDVGFITVFSLPYSHENIVYALKEGQTSKPFNTASGTHVYKVLKQRPHIGEWKTAQILVSLPENQNTDLAVAAEEKIRQAYELIQSGEDFSKIARIYSDDKFSYSTGGVLPPFSTGKYAPDFESKVVALKNDGDYTDIFKTRMGFHIVKRLEHIPYDSTSELYIHQLKEKLKRDSRIRISKTVFLERIKKETKFSVTNTVGMNRLLALADSVMANNNMDISATSIPENKQTIINYDKGSRTVADWLQFVKTYTTNSNLYKGERGEALWNKYVEISTRNYYKENLETHNEDFAFQMREFREGNLLFEIMERNVWGKAINDSAGLAVYYEQNKSHYTWEPSAEMIMFHVGDLNEAETIRTKIKNGISRATIEFDHPYILTDSGRFELSNLFDPNEYTPAPQTFSPFKVQQDNTVTFVYIIKMYPQGGQKSFEEARGLVISDYQEKLEKDWLETLKKKYPVKLYVNKLPKE